MEAQEDIKLRMLPDEPEEKANGGHGDGDDDDDGDVDGQAAHKSQDKPKSVPTEEVRNMFFKDGKTKIDFVLAWDTEETKKSEDARQAREVFEEALVKEGLKLEYDKRGKDVHFVKVHAPFEVLKRYADILKMRVPMKTALADQQINDRYAEWQGEGLVNLRNGGSSYYDVIIIENPIKPASFKLWIRATDLLKRFLTPFNYDHELIPKVKRPYTCPYARGKEYLFEMPDNAEDLFPQSTRSWVVDYILRRKPFAASSENNFCYGIHKMIADEYYTAAYPLHEGHWKQGSAQNSRKILFDHWANWKNALKFQPLDAIRSYFGEKIALYFAWLGFYTKMLAPAAIVGVIVFIYGLCIMTTNTVSQELCSANITMCPLCDRQCPYWKLSAACSHARASRIFDNGATVFFAIFMSLWGTLFLEFWKRKEATIQYKWDMTSFVSEEEPPRPEYLSKMEGWHTMKVNPITGIKEPHLPFWRKRFPIFLCSYSIMLLLAAVAVGAVIGVIAYRVSALGALQLIPKTVVNTDNSTIVASSADLIYKNASLVTTVTAAIINLIIIILLNFVYGKLAFWLTDWECLRTQSEYDNSITIKLFALQFVNYFASIVYIAFFKGHFVGRPGKYRRIFGGRQEECEAGGCLIELCIQLAIIMVGKQLIQNNFIEIVVPWIMKKLKDRCSKETREQKLAKTPWEKDYMLQPAASLSLFYEYLEMALQFGFLTIFCAAFPLAPLFALLNNIVEIRVDASKFTTVLRRPMAEKAATIGVWYSVLYGISRIAIITNAFIIALTSEFIPRLVYTLRYSEDKTLEGYVEFTLSHFRTVDFQEGERPEDTTFGQVDECRYKDFRNPPWEDPNYKRSEIFWHILAARLAFVCVFENVVVVITSLIAWLIPDMPVTLKERIRREAYITNEIILKTELRRAHGEEISDALLERVAGEEMNRYGSDGADKMVDVDMIGGMGNYSPRHSEDEEVGMAGDGNARNRGGNKTYV